LVEKTRHGFTPVAGFSCLRGEGYMELPSTLTDALAALSAAQADLAALNALTAEHSAVVAEFQLLKAKAADLSAALDVADANNRDLAAALDAVKAAEADAASKANAIVANLGVAPVAIVPEQISAPKTHSELWAHYMTLGFSERNEFYAANKKAMQL
jgi:hypothetical protein